MISGWDREMGEVVARLRDELVQNGSGILQYYAERTNALPVHPDMGGCLLLDPDGRVLEYDSMGDVVSEVLSPRWIRVALRSARESHKELQHLYPSIPDGAQTCPRCAGEGEVYCKQRDTIMVCPECAGAGLI